MPRPSVVGMQPQEGSDQTYGELGQGLYAGTEISANMRIHPVPAPSCPARRTYLRCVRKACRCALVTLAISAWCSSFACARWLAGASQAVP